MNSHEEWKFILNFVSTVNYKLKGFERNMTMIMNDEEGGRNVNVNLGLFC